MFLTQFRIAPQPRFNRQHHCFDVSYNLRRRRTVGAGARDIESTSLIARSYQPPDVIEFFEQGPPHDGRGPTCPLRQGFGTEFAGVIVDLPDGTKGLAIDDGSSVPVGGARHGYQCSTPPIWRCARLMLIGWLLADSPVWRKRQ